MIHRRRFLAATAGIIAGPAIVEKVGAADAFDWKQFKGQKIEVNYQLSPRADVAKASLKEFEELTGIRVGFEQIPEQQQRPKAALEMASGHPGFDVLQIAMHVQKRQVEAAHWMEDLGPYLKDPTLTTPDFDLADFSKPSMAVATAADGRITALPYNQDLFILFYNKAMLTEAGFTAPPKTYDELYAMAKTMTNPDKGVFGFVGRGLKNANVVLFDTFMLGWDQETVTADGKTLLTATPVAIEAAKYYQKLMRDCGPPGSVGFNWNEAQTTFMQGRAAMWIDGIGFSAPLLDPAKSRVTASVGFAPVPAGPKAHNTATFIDGIGVPAAAKNKKAAWYFCQYAAGQTQMKEILRSGSGTPPRASAYGDPAVQKNGKFPKDWFDTTLESLKLARSGLPVILPVTEFRDTIGVGLTNIVGGADAESELKKATETFQPILDKANAG
jgi:multiple sugar transport system substrate-binding protein